MPTKRRPTKRRKPVLKDATRASDDALREELQHVDLRKLDQALAKAIKSPGTGRAR